MNVFGYGLITAAAFAAVFLCAFCYRGSSWPKTIVKTVPMLALAVACVAEGLSPWLIAGLLLSALGDFTLSRPGKHAFLAGLVAFAAAHLAYIGLFVWGLSSSTIAPAFWVFGVIGALWIASFFVFLRHTGDMLVPVLIYIALISAMVMTASQYGHRWAGLLFGAMIFAVSDFVLATQLFRKLPRAWDIAASFVVWGFYVTAQFAIVLGVGMLAF